MKPVLRKLYEYFILGLIQTAVVYLIHTPYVFLWVGLTWTQYILWLAGGMPMSLAFGWLFAKVIIISKKRLFPDVGDS